MLKNIKLTKYLLLISGAALVFLTTTISKYAISFDIIKLAFIYYFIDYSLKDTEDYNFLNLNFLFISISLCIVFGFGFYNRWISSNTFINIFGRNLGFILIVVGSIGSLFSILFISYFLNYLSNKYLTNEKINTKLNEKRVFIILCLIYLIALISIIRSNFNYADDMIRVALGQDDWDNNSRFISNFLSHIIHGNGFLADVSPLQLFISIGVISLASVIIIKTIKNTDDFDMWDIIGVLPLGLMPYFLECFSFKYDSPYMALSILASVIPLLLIDKNKKIYMISIFFSVLFVCMTYQASLGIFPMIILLLMFNMFLEKKENKDIFSLMLSSAIPYMIGIIVFKLFFMIPKDNNVSNAIAGTSLIINNYKSYINLFLTDLKKGWLYVILLLAIWFVVSSTISSKQDKVITSIISIIVLVLMFLLSFGLYPALKAPIFHMRSMFGVDVFICLLILGIKKVEYKWVNRLLSIYLSWQLFAFCFAYGNAMQIQKEYVNFRIEEVLNDLTDYEGFDLEDEIVISYTGGGIEYSPVVKNIADGYNCNIIYRLLSSRQWIDVKTTYFYGFDNKISYANYLDDYSYSDWNIIHENYYHKIYENDNHFIIVLKQHNS